MEEEAIATAPCEAHCEAPCEATCEAPSAAISRAADLDKLTLELLMNKTNYKKYIEKTDPKKFSERQEFLTRIQKYRRRILALTEEYLENPDTGVSLDMNQAFDDYVRSAIRYLEDVDIQSRPLEDVELFV
jgi:hypothetical protein